MKDFLGHELAVGDEVVFSYDNELDNGVVTGFTGFNNQVIVIKSYDNIVERYSVVKMKVNQ